MAWADPSLGDGVTKIYHLCSMRWELSQASKDEILLALSAIAKRPEWAGRDISEPRGSPKPADLELVERRCSWKEVLVCSLKYLKLPFVINPLALCRFPYSETIHPADHA